MSGAIAMRDLYAAIEALPEGMTGEIIRGQMHTQPRPSARHLRAASVLDRRLGAAFDDGGSGSGGWWILIEPEIHFVRDAEVLVPDLAGWRRKRMPELPEDQRFEVVPDWICEILSPATASKDREVKMPVYARYGVRYAWIVDPVERTLQACERRDDTWELLAGYGEADEVSVAPFEAAVFRVGALWE